MKTDTIIDNTKLTIKRLELSSYATNAYVVICPKTQESALIDVPAGAPTIFKHLRGTKLKYILLTHSHVDHIDGLHSLRTKVNAPLAVHALDNQKWLPFPPEVILFGGEIIRVGKVKLKVLFTPGHTPGGVCYLIGNILISGDTIFRGGPGRSLGPFEFRQIIESITQIIFPLPDDTQIFPGHGDSTLLKTEKTEFAIFASRKHDPNLSGDIVWMTS